MAHVHVISPSPSYGPCHVNGPHQCNGPCPCNSSYSAKRLPCQSGCGHGCHVQVAIDIRCWHLVWVFGMGIGCACWHWEPMPNTHTQHMDMGHLHGHRPLTWTIAWAWTYYMGMDLLFLLVFIPHFNSANLYSASFILHFLCDLFAFKPEFPYHHFCCDLFALGCGHGQWVGVWPF